MKAKAGGLISAVKGFASKSSWLAAETSEVEQTLETRPRERRHAIEENLRKKLPGIMHQVSFQPPVALSRDAEAMNRLVASLIQHVAEVGHLKAMR